jgi:hypothetical protein
MERNINFISTKGGSTGAIEEGSQTRAAKRPRAVSHADSGCSSASGPNQRYHLNENPFYFQDGDIVLKVPWHIHPSAQPVVVSGTSAPNAAPHWQFFKVHRKRLSCSQIFADMLEIPQPDGSESYDDCAVVELADDAKNWVATLRWMYDPR